MSAKRSGDSGVDAGAQEPLAAKARSKRRHDLAGALRTLRFTLEGLQRGYRYDDKDAVAKIEALAKALVVIEKEVSLVAETLK